MRVQGLSSPPDPQTNQGDGGHGGPLSFAPSGKASDSRSPPSATGLGHHAPPSAVPSLPTNSNSSPSTTCWAPTTNRALPPEQWPPATLNHRQGLPNQTGNPTTTCTSSPTASSPSNPTVGRMALTSAWSPALTHGLQAGRSDSLWWMARSRLVALLRPNESTEPGWKATRGWSD
jgi:hypothetical protein